MKIVLAIDPAQPHAGYRDALLAAGALPGEVEIVQPGDALPEEFDGLLLSGGGDVDPLRYGETPVNGSVHVDADRDELDFELLSRAEGLEVPVFGICRGLQVLNVALGGTLWQDLPAQRPRGVEHSFPSREGHDRAHPAHEIRVSSSAPGALPLAAALAATDGAFVNSRHHQAVKDLAPGLVALAASPDDLVEAFARDTGPFLAAVQWHPENLAERADQKALFVEFLAAARRNALRRANSRPRSASPERTPNVHPGHRDGTPARDDRLDEETLGNPDAGEAPSPTIRGSAKMPEPA
ncbi:MAG TPA: type 1 glutamine amidotransferase [Thermoanaerobaculia bacterium]|nr:type 1 glutamine amidotransferase [Thermoanaerobaculia bacterium]